jgi:glycosyltransferase involved in cell wall biosynthesis
MNGRPLKIGIVAHLKHPIKEPYAGGLEMHTHSLRHGMQRRGHHVTVFAAEGSEPSGLEHISVPTRDLGDFFRQEHRAYRHLMRDLRHRDFDIIHNNSLHYLAVAMAHELPMPLLTTLHTPPFWELEGSMRLAGDAGNACAAVSESMRRAWQPIVTVQNVVTNGIDLAGFAFRETPDAQAYVIWFGRIVPEKGLHLAIDAARLAGVMLWVAGPISDRGYFDQCIVPRMNAQVRYLGHLPHAELAAAVGGARAFLFTPMWDEPYGLVVAESLACGTPVVSFARGAVPDLLDEGCGVLVEPNDVAAFSLAIARCLPLSRAACRRRAEMVADADAMISSYELLYRQLIASRRRHPPAAHRGVSAAGIDPSNGALIDFYARHLPSMLCPLPCPA